MSPTAPRNRSAVRERADFEQDMSGRCCLRGTRSGRAIRRDGALDGPPAFNHLCESFRTTSQTGTRLAMWTTSGIPLATIWTSPDSVESHLLFHFAGAERRFERCRADVAEAGVPPARIIETFDVLANGRAGLVS